MIDLIEITLPSGTVNYELFRGDFVKILNPDFRNSEQWVEQAQRLSDYPGWLEMEWAEYAVRRGEEEGEYLFFENLDLLLTWFKDSFRGCTAESINSVIVPFNSEGATVV